MINEENKTELIQLYLVGKADEATSQEIEYLIQTNESFYNDVMIHKALNALSNSSKKDLKRELLKKKLIRKRDDIFVKEEEEFAATVTPSVLKHIAETQVIETETQKKNKIIHLWQQPLIRVAAVLMGIVWLIWLMQPTKTWVDKTLSEVNDTIKESFRHAGAEDNSWKASGLKEDTYLEADKQLTIAINEDEQSNEKKSTAFNYYHKAFYILWLKNDSPSKAISFLEKARNEGHDLKQANILLMIAYLRNKQYREAKALKQANQYLNIPDKEINEK